MGLLELCLLTLLSPPQPAPQAPPASPVPAANASVPTAPVPPAGQDPGPAAAAAALARAERSGDAVPIADLAAFVASADAAVATRAAWLLGKRKEPAALPPLENAAATSPHAGVRLQAMAALLRQSAQRSVETAIRGLDDDDLQVRTIAAQLLGRVRSEAGLAPLLALLDRRAKADAGAAPAPDLQAALLALNDMEATAQLLPAATALQQSKVNDCGQALTFYFQNLSPRLAAADEATLLLSVLDHREPLLRRYAISRLGELRDPATAAALERRLGTEGTELRPLLEIAIAQVRNQQHGTPTDATPASGMLAGLTQRWQELTETQQWTVAGCGSLLVVAAGALAFVWRHRRNAALADAAPSAVDLVAPSDEYLQAEAAAAAAASEADAADATDEAGAAEVDVDSVPGAFANEAEATPTTDEVPVDDADWQPAGPSDDDTATRQP